MEPSLAWGLAWGDSWGWSWGPLHEVEEGRRPKATQIKLQKFREGKAWATHGFSKTKTVQIAARGQHVLPEATPTFPGRATTNRVRHKTICKTAGVRAGSRKAPAPCRADTYASQLHAAGAVRAAILTAYNDTTVGQVKAVGRASAVASSWQGASACERVRARGVTRTSDIEIVVILSALDRRK